MKRIVAVGAVAGVLAAAVVARGAEGYLGVATEPVEPGLAQHLGLPEGVGLTVVHVDEKGPCAGHVEPNDVLYSVGGQVIMNHEQLVAVVRKLHKPGDKVDVNVRRKGGDKTVSVTLGEAPAELLANAPAGRRPLRLGPPPGAKGRAAPGDEEEDDDANAMPGWPRADRWMRQWQAPMWPGMQGFGGDIQEQMRDLQKQMRDLMREMHGRRGGAAQDNEEENAPAEAEDDDAPAPGTQVFSQTRVHSSVTESDGKLSVTLESDGAGKNLKAVRDGKEIFNGPVDTEEQRAKLPEDVKQKFEAMEGKIKIDVQTHEGGKGGGAKVRVRSGAGKDSI